MPLKLPDSLGVKAQKPSELAAQPTFLFYGRGKSGKSTLAMSASEVPELSPVAMVDFEGSAEVGAEKYPEVDVYRTQNWEQSSKVLDALVNQKDHGYRTVILDPVNALQVQLQDEIVRRQPETQPTAKSNNSMGDRAMLMADWGVVWTRMRKLLEAFHAAPFTVILTAHADTAQDEQTGRMIMEPLMQGTKTKNDVTRIPSVVGYMSMHQDKEKGVYPVVRFAGGAGVVAGDRFGKLGLGIENPTMKTIYDKIYTGK